jgi:hypothetical protein
VIRTPNALNMTNDEVVLDALIAESLGIGSPLDNGLAARATLLPGPGRALQDDLQETISRLSAASPFMAPSKALRERILAATAPATFNLEAYRKDQRDHTRPLRWGLIAASVAIAGLIWYDAALQNRANAIAHMNAANQANQQLLVAQLADPDVKQVSLVEHQTDGTTHAIGKLLVDQKTHQMTIVMPNTQIAEGAVKRMFIDLNGTTTEIEAKGSGAPYYIGTSKTQIDVQDGAVGVARME